MGESEEEVDMEDMEYEVEEHKSGMKFGVGEQSDSSDESDEDSEDDELPLRKKTNIKPSSSLAKKNPIDPKKRRGARVEIEYEEEEEELTNDTAVAGIAW